MFLHRSSIRNKDYLIVSTFLERLFIRHLSTFVSNIGELFVILQNAILLRSNYTTMRCVFTYFAYRQIQNKICKNVRKKKILKQFVLVIMANIRKFLCIRILRTYFKYSRINNIGIYLKLCNIGKFVSNINFFFYPLECKQIIRSLILYTKFVNILKRYAYIYTIFYCYWRHGFASLPKKREQYTLLRSPHTDKKSREQFKFEYRRKLKTFPSFISILTARFIADRVIAGVGITTRSTSLICL
jgi:hypothetical protein